MRIFIIILTLALVPMLVAQTDATAGAKDSRRRPITEEERLLEKARAQALGTKTNQTTEVHQKKKQSSRMRKSPPSKSNKPPVNPMSKEARLQVIYERYMADQMTPAEYHEQRARILAEKTAP